MAADFSTPISSALQRTRRILFDGFDPAKYLVLGFAAFLATLPDSCSSTYRWTGDWDDWNYRGWWVGPRIRVDDWDGVFALLAAWSGCLAVGVAILVVLLWLRSHGQLVWFECVLYDRAAIVEPWSRLSRLSNSLFLWTLLYFAISIALGLAAAVPLGISLSGLDNGSGFVAVSALTGAAVSGGFLAILSVLVSFVWLLTSHFVVPIMYRHGLSAFQAWGKLAGLLRRAPVDFVLYGLLMLLFHVLVGIVLVLLVLLTCCVLALPLALPYVYTLMVLPVLTFYRALSIEFLAQYGPEFAVEPAWTEAPEAPSAG